MNKPTIAIWDSVGLGIIVAYPTGIFISNQVGGTACLHPKIEGIYLPLSNDYTADNKTFLSPEIDLDSYFMQKYNGTGATNGIDIEDIEAITTILKKYKLDETITIDVQKIKQSCEAWIHILINESKRYEIIKGFEPYPRHGILTWSNSD